MNLYEAALQIATVAHKGQTRNDGQPYITHPIAVADLLASKFCIETQEVASCTAFLHDIIEDTALTFSALGVLLWESVERELSNTENNINMILNSVFLLTRTKDESYAAYIFKIKVSKNPISIAVKLADLEHNLSDHKPGARRDKYELAVALLQE